MTALRVDGNTRGITRRTGAAYNQRVTRDRIDDETHRVGLAAPWRRCLNVDAQSVGFRQLGLRQNGLEFSRTDECCRQRLSIQVNNRRRGEVSTQQPNAECTVSGECCGGSDEYEYGRCSGGQTRRL